VQALRTALPTAPQTPSPNTVRRTNLARLDAASSRPHLPIRARHQNGASRVPAPLSRARFRPSRPAPIHTPNTAAAAVANLLRMICKESSSARARRRRAHATSAHVLAARRANAAGHACERLSGTRGCRGGWSGGGCRARASASAAKSGASGGGRHRRGSSGSARGPGCRGAWSGRSRGSAAAAASGCGGAPATCSGRPRHGIAARASISVRASYGPDAIAKHRTRSVRLGHTVPKSYAVLVVNSLNSLLARAAFARHPRGTKPPCCRCRNLRLRVLREPATIGAC